MFQLINRLATPITVVLRNAGVHYDLVLQFGVVYTIVGDWDNIAPVTRNIIGKGLVDFAVVRDTTYVPDGTVYTMVGASQVSGWFIDPLFNYVARPVAVPRGVPVFSTQDVKADGFIGAWPLTADFNNLLTLSEVMGAFVPSVGSGGTSGFSANGWSVNNTNFASSLAVAASTVRRYATAFTMGGFVSSTLLSRSSSNLAILRQGGFRLGDFDLVNNSVGTRTAKMMDATSFTSGIPGIDVTTVKHVAIRYSGGQFTVFTDGATVNTYTSTGSTPQAVDTATATLTLNTGSTSSMTVKNIFAYVGALSDAQIAAMASGSFPNAAGVLP